MRQHHALGLAGGARGIDDSRQFVAIARPLVLQPGLGWQPLVCVAQARLIVRGDLVQADHALDAAELVAHRAHLLPLFGSLEQQHPGLRIVDDVSRIVRPVHGIQRNHDQAQRHRRLFEHHPLRTVAQHQCDAVACRQVLAQQRVLPARHLVAHLRPGQCQPGFLPVVEIAVSDGVGRAFRPFDEQAIQRDRLFRLDVVIDTGRHTVLSVNEQVAKQRRPVGYCIRRKIFHACFAQYFLVDEKISAAGIAVARQDHMRRVCHDGRLA